jgi:hypothetical protein
VTAVGNGAEVLAFLREAASPPDLLLTDIAMPVLDGAKAARAAVQMWPGLRILYISGYADLLAVRSDLIDVDNNLIEKPLDAELLLRRVGAALAGDVARTAANDAVSEVR